MQGFTKMQTEFLNNANHRWNIKSGATRSGKTYLDYYVIPKRIRRVADKDGLIALLGNTKGTLQRNIVEPLQKIWGLDLVSDIKSDNTAFMFGEKVHCLGADKINQVDKLRGSSIKYCYGDEVVTWHPDVFSMLKSRLDKNYSRFDGTCNPDNPSHWFKKFIDSDVDIYLQNYSIYDNDYIDKDIVANLEREYANTVFFDRYILGKWVRAEGAIYRQFANNPDSFLIKKSDLPKLLYINIGVDFGGNGSQHAFVASGITADYKLIVLKAKSLKATGVDVGELIAAFINFADSILKEYGFVDDIYCDSAEQTIINSIRNETRYSVRNSIKNPILDRIRATCIMQGTHKICLVEGECDDLIDGLCNAVWNDKVKDTDERLDNGTSNIDILDAFEYSWEYYIRRLIDV